MQPIQDRKLPQGFKNLKLLYQKKFKFSVFLKLKNVLPVFKKVSEKSTMKTEKLGPWGKAVVLPSANRKTRLQLLKQSS